MTASLLHRIRAAIAAFRRRYNILTVTKDGGPESTVWAHWLFEVKGFCSIVLLRFENGSRDAYHSHAFDCISWVLAGELNEVFHPSMRTIAGDRPLPRYHLPNWWPVVTRRDHLHKVTSVGRTWVLSFRGPWAPTWREELPTGETVTLAAGRRTVAGAP